MPGQLSVGMPRRVRVARPRQTRTQPSSRRQAGGAARRCAMPIRSKRVKRAANGIKGDGHRRNPQRAGKPPVGCAGEEGQSPTPDSDGQAGNQQQGGDVPEEDGHDHAVDEHGGGPEGAAFEQAAGWFFERQQEAALADAQCQAVSRVGGRLLLISSPRTDTMLMG